MLDDAAAPNSPPYDSESRRIGIARDSDGAPERLLKAHTTGGEVWWVSATQSFFSQVSGAPKAARPRVDATDGEVRRMSRRASLGDVPLPRYVQWKAFLSRATVAEKSPQQP